MMKKKIGICGHFGLNYDLKNGQTIKTINIYNQLCKIYGKDNINILDTYEWKKNPIKFVIKTIEIMRKSKNLIVLPAQNGLKIFIPLYARLKRIYKTNLIYAVVGGWLPDYLTCKKRMIRWIKKFNAVLVETSGMKEKIEKLGINNVDILFNFKDIKKTKSTEVKNKYNTPLRACTFSRIIKEKGVSNAINAITQINSDASKVLYTLDIYGPIEDEYNDEFINMLKKSDKRYIAYKGSVSAEESANIIKEYDILLFPTYYEGEGMPGTIIDAFEAGVPIIASDWKYNTEIIKNGINGFIFETKNDEQLINIMKKIYLQEYDIAKIKKACLSEAEKYIPNEAVKILTKYIV